MILVLCAGLLPAWTLALQTPFRFVDDYVHSLARNMKLHTFLAQSASLRCSIRFKPVTVLHERMAYAAFSAHPEWHHASRLAMKAATFAALLAVALRLIREASGVPLQRPERLSVAALAMALFFYSPNAPEARLAPAEIPAVMYLMGALWALYGSAATPARRQAREALFLVCFAFMTWAKEPNFITGAVVLVAAFAERIGTERISPGRALRRLLPHLVLWAHAAVKVFILHRCGGYGRTVFSVSSLRQMLGAVPGHVLLGDSVWWMPIVLVGGLLSFVALGAVRAQPQVRLRGALLIAVLAGSLLQYIILWQPVLRYAYPATSMLVLLAVAGLGSTFLRAASRPAPWPGMATAVALVLALAVAAANGAGMTVQYFRQWQTGTMEYDLVRQAERLMEQAAPGARLRVLPSETFTDGLHIRFLDSFFNRGRRIPVAFAPTAEDVPAGDYLVSSRSPVPGFEVAASAAVPAPPRLLAWAAAIGAGMGAAPMSAVLTDAGSPESEPAPLLILKRQQAAP